MVAHKNIHKKSWINVGGTNGTPNVYTHHNGPQQDLVFCFYKLLAPTRQTKTLETTFFKKLFHDISDATKQVRVANLKVLIIPVNNLEISYFWPPS